MVCKKSTATALALMAVCALAVPAQGQFIKLVTDFEGPYAGGLNSAQVVFRPPGFSGSTRGLDPNVIENSFWAEQSAFVTVHSGTHAVITLFGWENSSDPSAWIRQVTTNTANFPNPSLHLEGKVRVWLAARAWTTPTFSTQVNNGNLFVGLGVRETGIGVPQGANGGTAGDVEWVGIDAKRAQLFAGTNGICDTTANPESDDVQVNPMGANVGFNGVCIDAGTNGAVNTTAAGDDQVAVIPDGTFLLPSDGVIREYVFDLPALELSGNVFSLVGDASLGATPSNRGTLDHLAFTNDAAVNGPVNAKVWIISIDDLTFEAPVIDPPRIISSPAPLPLAESVDVEFVESGDLVEVFRLEPGGGETLLGSEVATSTIVTVATSPLPGNVSIVARRTVGADTSDNSQPVVVTSPGNGAIRLATAIRETDFWDNALDCGDNGRGFDPNGTGTLEFIGADGTAGFGISNGRRIRTDPAWRKIEFDPCVDGVTLYSGNGELDINSTGETKAVWEGLYFRIDNESPTTGPYTVYIDDLKVENADGVGLDCFIDDFESYTPGEFLVEGTVDSGTGFGTADTVAEGDDVQITAQGAQTHLGKIIIAAGTNGVIDTTPATGEFIDRVHARFANPGVAGGSQGLAPSPDQSEVTDEEAFSGTQSLKVQWGFLSAANPNSLLRLTSNEALLASGAPHPGQHETFFNPDSVVNLTNAACENDIDVKFTFMMLLKPPAIPADCDGDGDVDLADYGCFQQCIGDADPFTPPCDKLDVAPNGAPDGVVDTDDFELFNILLIGPN
jgi:hypothetical protein